MSFAPSRRSFMSAVTSLAGIAAMQATAGEAAGQASTPGDLGWLDGFKGRHKQVYDFGGVDLADPLPPLRFPRNISTASATSTGSSSRRSTRPSASRTQRFR